MFSDRIVDFPFLIKFDRSGPAIICSFSTITEHVSYASKKLLIKKKTSSTIVCVTLEGLWMVSDGIVDFRFFIKFDRSRPTIIFRF